jgi:hypothetical protein
VTLIERRSCMPLAVARNAVQHEVRS